MVGNILVWFMHQNFKNLHKSLKCVYRLLSCVILQQEDILKRQGKYWAVEWIRLGEVRYDKVKDKKKRKLFTSPVVNNRFGFGLIGIRRSKFATVDNGRGRSSGHGWRRRNVLDPIPVVNLISAAVTTPTSPIHQPSVADHVVQTVSIAPILNWLLCRVYRCWTGLQWQSCMV